MSSSLFAALLVSLMVLSKTSGHTSLLGNPVGFGRVFPFFVAFSYRPVFLRRPLLLPSSPCLSSQIKPGARRGFQLGARRNVGEEPNHTDDTEVPLYTHNYPPPIIGPPGSVAGYPISETPPGQTGETIKQTDRRLRRGFGAKGEEKDIDRKEEISDLTNNPKPQDPHSEEQTSVGDNHYEKDSHSFFYKPHPLEKPPSTPEDLALREQAPVISYLPQYGRDPNIKWYGLGGRGLWFRPGLMTMVEDEEPSNTLTKGMKRSKIRERSKQGFQNVETGQEIKHRDLLPDSDEDVDNEQDQMMEKPTNTRQKIGAASVDSASSKYKSVDWTDPSIDPETGEPVAIPFKFDPLLAEDFDTDWEDMKEIKLPGFVRRGRRSIRKGFAQPAPSPVDVVRKPRPLYWPANFKIQIRLLGNYHEHVQMAVDWLQEGFERLPRAVRRGLLLRGPRSMPMWMRWWTFLKSPFGHKDARQQLKVEYHEKIVDIYRLPHTTGFICACCGEREGEEAGDMDGEGKHEKEKERLTKEVEERNEEDDTETKRDRTKEEMEDDGSSSTDDSRMDISAKPTAIADDTSVITTRSSLIENRKPTTVVREYPDIPPLKGEFCRFCETDRIRSIFTIPMPYRVGVRMSFVDVRTPVKPRVLRKCLQDAKKWTSKYFEYQQVMPQKVKIIEKLVSEEYKPDCNYLWPKTFGNLRNVQLSVLQGYMAKAEKRHSERMLRRLKGVNEWQCPLQIYEEDGHLRGRPRNLLEFDPPREDPRLTAKLKEQIDKEWEARKKRKEEIKLEKQKAKQRAKQAERSKVLKKGSTSAFERPLAKMKIVNKKFGT